MYTNISQYIKDMRVVVVSCLQYVVKLLLVKVFQSQL